MNKKTWWKLLLPVIVWALVLGYYSLKASVIDRNFRSADGLVLNDGNKSYQVQLERSYHNEQGTYTVTIARASGEVVFEETVIIDHDLFGTGFVSGMQIDEDENFEIVVWGDNFLQGEAFYLDLVNGRLARKAFDNLPLKSKELTEEYRKLSTQGPLVFGFLLLLTVLYYLVLFLVFIFSWLSGRKPAGPGTGG